jgi:hypothetical protein
MRVHDSGGMREFIPEELRWTSYDDLKEKIVRYMELSDESWEQKRKELWARISGLNAEAFPNSIWSHLLNFFTCLTKNRNTQ